MCILLATPLKVGKKALIDLQAHDLSWQSQPRLFSKLLLFQLRWQEVHI